MTVAVPRCVGVILRRFSSVSHRKHLPEHGADSLDLQSCGFPPLAHSPWMSRYTAAARLSMKAKEYRAAPAAGRLRIGGATRTIVEDTEEEHVLSR